MSYEVTSIQYDDCKEWLLHKHYAKRLCSISFAFGLYDGLQLVGVCTFGKPASSNLCTGVCGVENSKYVYELNRLCVNDGLPKNTLSYFVSRCLKMLPPLIIISYADTAQNHHGYIYQATNWIYTGLSAKRTDWKIKGKENLHGITIADEFRNKKNRIKLIKEKYGKDFYLSKRSRKHRYIFFTGSKTQKKNWKKKLKYKMLQYPKGLNGRYDASYKPNPQIKMF